jgi:hypothetical protein
MIPLADWPIWVNHIFSPLNRWAHIVASALLLGGILFFEFVVPVATEDLIDEQRLAVFGRARWSFRRIVLLCVIVLVVTGSVSTWRMMERYNADSISAGSKLSSEWPWYFGHLAFALIGLWIAMFVTRTRRLAPRPVAWMRGLMVILLICIYLASVVRHVRIHVGQMRETPQSGPSSGAP